MAEAAGWTVVKGSGLAVEGSCILLGLFFTPVTANDYVTLYDGLDATSGRKFAKFVTAVVVTWPFAFSGHPRFSSGIYVEGIDGDVETTIVYDRPT